MVLNLFIEHWSNGRSIYLLFCLSQSWPKSTSGFWNYSTLGWYFTTKNQLFKLGSRISSGKIYYPPAPHQAVYRVCEHHALDFLIQGSIPEVQYPRYGWGREDSRAKSCGCVVPNMFNGLPQMCFPCIFRRGYPVGLAFRDTQMVTKGKYCSLPRILPIPLRVSIFSIKHQIWSYLLSVICYLWWYILHIGAHKEGKSPRKMKKLVEDHSDITTQ